MELWISGWEAGFLIQRSWAQIHWVASKTTQPFIFPRLFKCVPGTAEDLLIKSKLSPRSGSQPWGSWTLVIKRAIKYFKLKFLFPYLRINVNFSLSVENLELPLQKIITLRILFPLWIIATHAWMFLPCKLGIVTNALVR